MAKKRGNSEGSIQQRDNGSWRVQITLDGKRLSHSAKTRQECQAWMKDTIRQIDSGLSFRGANMRLSELMESWMGTVKQNRRPKTHIQYEGLLRLYILPEFGNIRLRDLHPIQIEKYLTRKQEEKVGDRTCQLIYSTLHTALHWAVRKGLIGRNPLDSVDKPVVRNPKPKITLEPDQIQNLLIVADDERNATLYQLALVTGVREGEILGLKWQDVNWNKSYIKIQRQVQRIPGQGLVFSVPKTKAGVRPIAIGTMTMERLQQHREQQMQEKLVAGDKWKENDLVFPSDEGTPMDPHNLLKAFKALLQKAGLPTMRFHDLRHTSITLVLNEIGAPIKEAQRRAGHASPSTTINIYGGEATSKLDDVVAQGLDELVTPRKIKLHQGCTKEESLPYR